LVHDRDFPSEGLQSRQQLETIEEPTSAEEDALRGFRLHQFQDAVNGRGAMGDAVRLPARSRKLRAEVGGCIGASALVADGAAWLDGGGASRAIAGGHGLANSLQELIAWGGHSEIQNRHSTVQ
jgi:hypothetical protein